MAIVYFDSSAFVKLLVNEDGTDLAIELWDGCDAAVSSRLAYPEVRAALAAAARSGRIKRGDLALLEQDWEMYWSAVRVVELTPAVARAAGDLCRKHGLRGADGVHLASALELLDADPVIAVWDGRLAVGAAAVGLPVAPAPASGSR
ncbi:unannotated protein [freshwater metagenome]|uniref:Unannotated protein n=1 Tax=freshwater metagenome TaxID=449393 RepID=A0A6J7E6M7_9ZZZZ|nr:PIN domain-containing protein [Actinomycetota bacterium]